jgi:O-acetylhomoserine/O-acetylserine sulfhydrylase-like pyridoxal-dependent enzyme
LINENTKLVWVETNESYDEIVDIEAIAKITKENKVLLQLIILQHRIYRIH